MSARLMSSTAGTLVLVVVGVTVVCVGGYHVHKGASRTFMDDLTISDATAILVTRS